MKFDVLTLFTEIFAPIKTSILSRAENDGKIEINLVNIRDFSHSKTKRVDDAPYGGGAGMLMQVQPIYDAVQSVKTDNSYVVYMSPKGTRLCQSVVKRLAQKQHLIVICGHYEGIDQRAIDLCVDEEISIGDYVLTGGELPAMVLIDSVARYVPGVLNSESLLEESFSNGRLEYPQYTRPEEFMGKKVPEVLLSGNHQKIKEWRLSMSKKVEEI